MKNNEKKAKKSIVKSGLVLSLMTLASRIMGLIREMTKASFLGTSMYADAFTTAFMLPNLFRRLFAENAVSAAFIPTFKKYLAKGDDLDNRRETQEFLKATFTLVSFLTACVVVLGVLLAPVITPIFCKKPIDPSNIGWTVQLQAWLAQHIPALFNAPVIPSADEYAAQLADWLLKKDEIAVLTRIMFPYLFVISIAALFQGILNGCKIFAPSGFTPVLFNGMVILGTFLFSPFTANPARAMSIAVIAGGCIQALFQLPFVLKTGWKVCFTSLKKTFTNPGTRKVISLVLPTIVGMAAYQLNDVVSTVLANRAGEGIASSLSYSLRLQELILGIFAVSIGTVILPDLSGLAGQKKWDDFNKMLIQAIKIMTLISIPVTAYSLITGTELVSLIYKLKTFDEKSVALTVGEFRYHIVGLLFISLIRIICTAFYAQDNPKLPTLAGIICFASNIFFALILVHPMSGNGIALALSAASLVNTVFLFVFMKKLETIQVKKVVKNSLLYAGKMIIFSVIASIPTYLVHTMMVKVFANSGKLIAYGAPVAISAIIFAVIGVAELIITKDEVVSVILKKVRK